MRKKLIELVNEGIDRREPTLMLGERIADHLIANGVTVHDTSNEIKRLENQVAALKKSNRNWRRKVQRMRNRRKENDYG